MKKLLPIALVITAFFYAGCSNPAGDDGSSSDAVADSGSGTTADSGSGTTADSGSDAASVRGLVTTFAGSGSGSLTDGVGTSASFNNPQGMTTDGTNIYLADSQNSSIRKIEISSGSVSTLVASDAGLYFPDDVVLVDDALYVTDTHNHRIRKVSISTGTVTTFAGTGGQGSTDGAASVAEFLWPRGIVSDGTYLYVVDTSNNKIRKIDIATAAVSTLAGNGSEDYVDGAGTSASFHDPRGICLVGGSLYVADRMNHAIRKIDTGTGEVATVAGTGSSGYDEGIGTSASFSFPEGVASDGTYLYIGDFWNNVVRQIKLDTMEVTTLAGSGSFGSEDGTGTAASFQYPSRPTVIGSYLYVSDFQNNKIRRIRL